MHPLTPLSAEEIAQTVAIFKAAPSTASSYDDSLATRVADTSTIFNTITLLEPAKKIIVAYDAAVYEGTTPEPVPRVSLATILLADGTLVEAEVDLGLNQVVKMKDLGKGLQPTLTPDDCLEVERIAIEDERVLSECAKCGFTDRTLIICDPWSIGYMEEFEGQRIVQVFMYARMYEDDNQYAHPLDFVPIVDLISKKVIKIEYLPERTSNTPVPVQKKSHNYMEKFQESLCTLLKPLEITQPSGPSFSVTDNEISWHKFKFRIGFNYREGLVLYNVRWCDGGDERSILYRCGLNEMFVPYGDPRYPYNRKAAFDIGDYGLGYCANSLELGCDCLGVIKYFDAVLNNNKGEPYTIKNAVCMHEEDAGIVWKHTEYRNGKAEVRRNRKLVVSFIATVVNYEYAFYYSFYVDGTITFEIKATGELSTNLTPTTPSWGTLVAPNINAQFHQHIFNIKLDFAIDGLNNSISELTVEAMPTGPENPFGNGFGVTEVGIKSEMESGRVADSAHSRVWKIYNPSTINPRTCSPTSYKLVPTSTPTLLAHESSSIAKRAVFATKHLWVTKYNDEEKWAAGTYINQNKGGEGIPKFIASNESLENTELTVWHTFGVTHIPRAEDFPVMPVETVGFTLKPYGFFEANPSLDLPSSVSDVKSSKCC